MVRSVNKKGGRSIGLWDHRWYWRCVSTEQRSNVIPCHIRRIVLAKSDSVDSDSVRNCSRGTGFLYECDGDNCRDICLSLSIQGYRKNSMVGDFNTTLPSHCLKLWD